MQPSTTPDNHWSWSTRSGFAAARQCGELILVGQQVALDAQGRPLSPGEPLLQLHRCVDLALDSLRAAGADARQVVKLLVYYVPGRGLDVSTITTVLRERIAPPVPPVLTLVPVPYLAAPGIDVSLELVASARAGAPGATRAVVPEGRLASGFSEGVRAGDFVFVGGQMAVDASGRVLHPGDIVEQSRRTMERIEEVLQPLGATLDDVVKFNIYYVGEGTFEDWEVAARVRAGYFSEPGPVATGIPVPRLEVDGLLIRMEVWAMPGSDGARPPRRHSWPDGHWDWPIHLPYKHGLLCGDMFFVGGQVGIDSRGVVLDPGEIVPQTHRALDYIDRVLALLPGVERRHIAKSTTFFQGSADPGEQDPHLAQRSQWLAPAGAVNTEVALPALAYRGMMTEIEVLGCRSRS